MTTGGQTERNFKKKYIEMSITRRLGESTLLRDSLLLDIKQEIWRLLLQDFLIKGLLSLFFCLLGFFSGSKSHFF